MKRDDFVLYDVVDLAGPTKGLKNNSSPLDYTDAYELLGTLKHAKIVPTEDKDWENYVYKSRYESPYESPESDEPRDDRLADELFGSGLGMVDRSELW